MAKLAKRVKVTREGIDRVKLYPLDEAVKMVKDRANAKFDETIEVAMNLGVDPRHADQMVRGVVALPKRSQAATLTSTAALPHPTSCRWSAGSARCSVRVA